MDRVVVCKGKGGSEGGRIGKGTCMMTSMWGEGMPLAARRRPPCTGASSHVTLLQSNQSRCGAAQNSLVGWGRNQY
jgi:hypothetical protein